MPSFFNFSENILLAYHRTSCPWFFNSIAIPVNGLKCPSAGTSANNIFFACITGNVKNKRFVWISVDDCYNVSKFWSLIFLPLIFDFHFILTLPTSAPIILFKKTFNYGSCQKEKKETDLLCTDSLPDHYRHSFLLPVII